MSDYKKMLSKALNKKSKRIDESLVYPEGLKERMHPQLEKDLADRTHSLGNHPIFPEGDESTFEQKIIGQRFLEIAKRYKKAFDTENIDEDEVKKQSFPLVRDAMQMESKHKKELQKLAIEMVRQEFDMDEDVVEIHAELTDNINLIGTREKKAPVSTDMQFKNHEEAVNAKDEVYKRRFLNAMIQGSAIKCNHMFHMVDDELTDMDPRLPNRYSKLMANADLMYFLVPEMENGLTGGIVRVQFPSKSSPKAVIHAQAIVFPVLVQELVKGVMELLAAHGLPKNKKMGEYVIAKADYLAAEPWDMKIGSALWSKFMDMIEVDDMKLKHHIFMELASLPVKEFNYKMREIMAGTKEGKKIVQEIVGIINDDFKNDEFNEAMDELSKKEKTKEPEGFAFDELMGEEKEGFKFDELMGEDDEGFDFEDLF